MPVLVIGVGSTSSFIVSSMRRLGYVVEWAQNDVVATRFLRDFAFDLVVMNVSLPPTDGFKVLHTIRACRDLTVPVLILSGQLTIEERVRVLDMGADDYLAIPFDAREFEARTRCLLRRRIGGSTNQLVCERITLDLLGKNASIDGRPLELARRELCLLEALMVGHGRTLSKDLLLQQIYGLDSAQHENAVEVLIARLRRKLTGSGVEITTRRGLGYSLSPIRGPTALGPPMLAPPATQRPRAERTKSYGATYS